jgi:hypothetical protein
MQRLLKVLIWTGVVALGTASFAVLALRRGETVSAAWLITAAVCFYAVGYRFYSRIIAANVFALDVTRRTPAERLNDGRDYVPTNRWIVFGHHFAAIAGPGPLVGPTLAAQFGFLPGALWIVIGVVLGGAVQDCVILCSSVRRNGKTLGQMAKEEIGTAAGLTALVAVLGIMIVLIAVLALVIVNALGESPWGVVTVGLTIPIALLMGGYMRWIRPHRVLEATIIGLALLVVALYVGRWVSEDATLAPMFTLSRMSLAWLIMIYGFAASVLPVWLLLAPRDYLSAFVKIRRGVGPRGRPRPSATADAGPYAIRGWDRAGLCREALPLCVHHYRLRSDLRIPFTHRVGHDAQDPPARNRRALHRVRRDAHRVAGRDAGPGGGMRAHTGNLLRDQRPAVGDRHDRRERGRGGCQLGVHARSRGVPAADGRSW